MSRTYTLQATTYGGRATTRNMDMATMQSWSDGKRIGCWKVGSTEYWGAVSFYFDITPVRNKTIESIKLAALCNGTFDYAEEVIYNVKSNASIADWTIPSHNHEVTVPRYGTIPIIDVTSFGLPDHGYVIGGYYRTYAYCNITGGTLTVVTAETAKTITYNGNGGSTPAATTIWGEGSWSGNVTPTVPTRTGYAFNGWNTKADGTGTHYASGASITITANVTLYAEWTALKSTIDEAPNTEIGSAITVEWTNYGNFTNKIRFVFGSTDTGELSASGQYKSYNIPNSWCDEVPNTTSGTATVYLYTYLNGTLLGTDTKTFSAIVPDSVVPSIDTVTATKVNDNPTVDSWDIYLQNFSKVLLQVSGGAAGRGAAIASYKFLGQNINVTNQTTNASSSATSGTIEVNGSLVYTVRITDSRGRVAEKNVTISVVAYSLPSIGSVNAIRSNSDGTENAVTGTSIKASAIFTWTQVGSNQLASSLSYKKHTDVNYTQAQSGITSGTDYVIAVGLADIAFSYDVKVEISDTLGNTSSFVVTVPPVVGIAFGLKNDRARFGGPVEKAGLQVDWDADFKQDVNIDGNLNGGGVVKTVNNTAPDSSGNVNVSGGGSVESVNNVMPDANGNVMLTPADIGAFPVSGGSITGHVSVTGVADIESRRCSATLQSSGWYRVMQIDAGSTVRVEGGLGAIVNFNITRRQGQSTNEVHSITLDFVRSPALAFVNENSKSGTLLIDKIRYNTAGTVGYIDIHYTGTTAEDVAVCFDVNTLSSYFSSFTAESLHAVADAPVGETVLATHLFAATVPESGAGYIKNQDGTMIQWGVVSGVSFSNQNMKSGVASLPQPFIDTNYTIIPGATNTGVNAYLFRVGASPNTASTFNWVLGSGDSSNITAVGRGFNWLAFGRWR